MITQYVNKIERAYSDSSSSNSSPTIKKNSPTKSDNDNDDNNDNNDDIDDDDIDLTNEEELKAIFSSRAGTPSLRKVMSKTNFKISTTRSIRDIQYHDLRHLENQFNIHEQPQIMVRRHCVMLSLNPIKAIVLADALFLIAPIGSDSVIQETYDHIVNAFNNDDNILSTFEIKAYKAILSTVCSLHLMEHSNTAASLQRLLVLLSPGKDLSIGVEYQEQIRIIKTAVSSLIVKVNGYRRLFTELLTSAEDISLMNLSLLKKKPSLSNKPLSIEILNDNEECSFLLESFMLEYHSLESKLQYLQSAISSADELMSFRLDTSRNELLVVEMILGIVIVSIACGVYITGLFGMNLFSGIEEGFGILPFWIMTGALTAVVITSATILFLWFRKTGTFSIHEELRFDDWEKSNR